MNWPFTVVVVVSMTVKIEVLVDVGAVKVESVLVTVVSVIVSY